VRFDIPNHKFAHIATRDGSQPVTYRGARLARLVSAAFSQPDKLSAVFCPYTTADDHVEQPLFSAFERSYLHVLSAELLPQPFDARAECFLLSDGASKVSFAGFPPEMPELRPGSGPFQSGADGSFPVGTTFGTRESRTKEKDLRVVEVDFIYRRVLSCGI